MRWLVYGRMRGKRWSKATGAATFGQALDSAIGLELDPRAWDETLLWPDDGTRPVSSRTNGRSRETEVEVTWA